MNIVRDIIYIAAVAILLLLAVVVFILVGASINLMCGYIVAWIFPVSFFQGALISAITSVVLAVMLCTLGLKSAVNDDDDKENEDYFNFVHNRFHKVLNEEASRRKRREAQRRKRGVYE